MTRLTRETQQIFANSAGNRQITAFGTAKAESPTFTKELADIQNTNYLYGWAQALLPDKAPFEEDMNALFYVITRQLAYLFQSGMPEYDQNTEYGQYDMCRGTGSGVIYQSLVDGNIGNSLDDTNYWIPFITGGTIASYEIGAWQIVADDNLLPNEAWLEGGKLLKTQCPKLAAKWGDRYAPVGASDTDVYLYLPDTRNRALWGANGAGDYGYINAGLPSHYHYIANTDYVGQYSRAGNLAATTYLIRGSFTGNYDESYGLNGNSNVATVGKTSNPMSENVETTETVQPPAIKVRVKTRYY